MNELDLTKADWERNRNANVELIKMNKAQIIMAERVISLCDEKIREFTEGEREFGVESGESESEGKKD